MTKRNTLSTIANRKDGKSPIVQSATALFIIGLFVSKYLLELPKKEEMQAFINAQLKEVGRGE